MGKKSKDPAFLFYPSDFLTGTILFTDEQIGKYIKLLCIQHQHGGRINKDFFEHYVGDDSLLKSKFKKDSNGYFNVRLDEEIEKRKEKSLKLSKNAQKKYGFQRENEIV